jgi:DNA-binding XRE family transcriptional regulator
MSKTANNLTTLEEHLENHYGAKGTASRNVFDEEFEAFQLGVMLQELRKEQGLTQEQLANRCGTSKTYISRIENNASEIRLSTLVRILRDGLGKKLKVTVEP